MWPRQAERLVITPRMQFFCNLNFCRRLVREEEIHFLFPHASRWRLPSQRPKALEQRKQIMHGTQFLDQHPADYYCHQYCSWHRLPRKSSRLPWTCRASRTSSTDCSKQSSLTQLGRCAEQKVNSSSARTPTHNACCDEANQRMEPIHRQ